MRKIKISTASENDTLHFEEVLDANNNCRTVYADKGYVDSAREERLTEQGLNVQIQRKGAKSKPISKAQQGRNHRIAKTRARIEHVFAALAQMGARVRQLKV